MSDKRTNSGRRDFLRHGTLAAMALSATAATAASTQQAAEHTHHPKHEGHPAMPAKPRTPVEHNHTSLRDTRDFHAMRRLVEMTRKASDFEFIANNPGDWMFHCHMTHHMMNHMVSHVGPRIRESDDIDRYLTNLDSRPSVQVQQAEPKFKVPGYPQGMKGMSMSEEFMETIWGRREFMGMRASVAMSLMGLMTCLRVLPEDLYHKVMETDETIPKGSIFKEIVERFGNPADYEQAPMHMMHGSM